jgi:hypothetical protein
VATSSARLTQPRVCGVGCTRAEARLGGRGAHRPPSRGAAGGRWRVRHITCIKKAERASPGHQQRKTKQLRIAGHWHRTYVTTSVMRHQSSPALCAPMRSFWPSRRPPWRLAFRSARLWTRVTTTRPRPRCTRIKTAHAVHGKKVVALARQRTSARSWPSSTMRLADQAGKIRLASMCVQIFGQIPATAGKWRRTASKLSASQTAGKSGASWAALSR